jgi:hypothetical protein
LKNLTIHASCIEQDKKGITQFSIAEGHTDSINILNSHSLLDVYKFIDLKQPSNVILITSNMYGKEIVGLLERFLSMRYKPIIFDITIENSNSQTRTMVIKFQCI